MVSADKMIKITVAIPVYNTGKHLIVALDSLRHQTMPPTDFEIICVNDCSTDDSKEIIKTYSKSMGNLVLIDRAENSGTPSIPRNEAIEAARGEYIHFMDSDDFLGEEALERLYEAAQKNRSDIIFGKHIGVNGRAIPTSMYRKGNLPRADIIKHNLITSLGPTKMFKLSLLKENNIRFPPNARICEDQLFVMQCYLAAKVITILADYYYYFVVARGDGNLSAKYFPAKDFFIPINRLMEFLDESIQDEAYKKKVKVAYLNRFLQGSRLRRCLLTTELTDEQKREWLNETQNFISQHIDQRVIQSLKPHFQKFLNVAIENDLQKLAKVRY